MIRLWVMVPTLIFTINSIPNIWNENLHCSIIHIVNKKSNSAVMYLLYCYLSSISSYFPYNSTCINHFNSLAVVHVEYTLPQYKTQLSCWINSAPHNVLWITIYELNTGLLTCQLLPATEITFVFGAWILF